VTNMWTGHSTLTSQTGDQHSPELAQNWLKTLQMHP
jgi:hypothetical protein